MPGAFAGRRNFDFFVGAIGDGKSHDDDNGLDGNASSPPLVKRMEKGYDEEDGRNKKRYGCDECQDKGGPKPVWGE